MPYNYYINTCLNNMIVKHSKQKEIKFINACWIARDNYKKYEQKTIIKTFKGRD